jgi:ATP phosphoribosyltransferase regulatory subunit
MTSVEPAAPAEAMAAIRAPFHALDARLVDAPVMQPLALLLDLAGEAMRARLLVVQGDGGEEACLRPDFTLPIARMHIASGGGAGRYTYEGKAFRAAPRGSGHAEEFIQLGLEAYGAADVPTADAEVAAVAWRASAAGGRGDLTMIMGDVALFSAFITALGLADSLAARLKRAFSSPRALQAELDRAQADAPPLRQGDRLSALLAGLPEAEASAALEDMWAIAGIQPVGGRSAGEIVHRLVERAAAVRGPRLSPAEAGLIQRFLHISDRPRQALDQVAELAREGGVDIDAPLQAWAKRLAALIDQGADEQRLNLSTGFGRAFGYYDGFLFEVRSAALGETAPVAGGGRYDSLPARLGDAGSGAAVGCMVRPARAWAGGGAGS